MNDAELEIAANELDIDVQAMRELQENYLNYKKIQNTKDLQNYLASKGKIEGNKIDIPDNLRKYFVNNNPNNSTLQSEESNGNLNRSLNESIKKSKNEKKSNQNL